MLLLKFWKWPSCHSKKDESRNVREYETQLGRLTSYNWSDYNLHTWEKRRAFLGWESVRERACSSGEGLVHCWSRWSLVSPSLSLKGQCWEQPGLQGHFYELPTPDGDQRISGEWPSCLHVLSLWPGGRGLRENTACNPVFPIIYKKKQSHQEILSDLPQLQKGPLMRLDQVCKDHAETPRTLIPSLLTHLLNP